jgi:hypothetical protein
MPPTAVWQINQGRDLVQISGCNLNPNDGEVRREDHPFGRFIKLPKLSNHE